MVLELLLILAVLGAIAVGVVVAATAMSKRGRNAQPPVPPGSWGPGPGMPHQAPYPPVQQPGPGYPPMQQPGPGYPSVQQPGGQAHPPVMPPGQPPQHPGPYGAPPPQQPPAQGQ